ncbi:D-2-hydroxyacid dehydrogenase [Nakamurella endophytica]|uniref:2-hydroxyacid dehydrogenase n=1 Tax=Nakamurella endophytica TaxID=1748367 RepID=A0A917SKI3_9ACTN|nr:D-2-hydroxyacid dehydrogenase [Nakamurella endophytica]GGL84393.1 2-hydroxyacid dehydrogenase [Nakamurella endophytica]
MTDTDRLTIALATPLDPELRSIITDVDPRVDLVVDDDLLPPQLQPGDHSVDPSFRRTPAQQQAFDELLDGAQVLYGVPDVSAAALTRAVRANPRLRWVHTMAAGGGATVRDAGLTPDELERVVFTTSAGVHGAPLAEWALFGLLAGAKDLARLQRQQGRHEWSDRWPMGQLREQTVLVVGLGGIGAETARLCKAFGATVLGVKRRPEPVEHVDEVHPVADLATVVARADAVVVTLPGTAATTGLFDRDVFAAVRPGTTLVNVGRGSVVDETALLAALDDGRIGAAFLDVTATEPLPPDSPLWDRPQVVISPHTAALSVLEDRRIAELFADNLRRFLDGRGLRNVVDTTEFY